MPKKQKEPMKEFHLKFTGKVSMIIELEDHGPLIYNINDLDVLKKIVGILMDATDNTTPVNSYNKREEAKFRKMLESFE